MITTTQPAITLPVPGGLSDTASGWELPVPTVLTPPPDDAEPKPVVTQDQDHELVQGLRKGEDPAVGTLLDRYHSRLLRLAEAFVPSRAVAEEVVQETWLAVWEGIHRFKGESSFKTWLYRILTNRAKSKGIRERRYVPFPVAPYASDSDLDSPGDLDRLPSSSTSSRSGDDWQTTREEHTPERLLLSKEGMAHIEQAIRRLPLIQRQMITLRDLEGLGSEEICHLLGTSPSNQRVILHRAREKVRRALDQYLEGPSATLSTSPS